MKISISLDTVLQSGENNSGAKADFNLNNRVLRAPSGAHKVGDNERHCQSLTSGK